MFSTSFAFAALLIAASIGGIYAGIRLGKSMALGSAMAIASISGSWFEIRTFGVAINVATATAAVFLVGYCLHSRRRLFATGNWIDAAVAALVLWHIFVDIYHGDSPVQTVLLAYGQWALPYAAGRYAWIRRDDLGMLALMYAAAACVISIACAAESLTSWNLWEWITPRDTRVSFVRGLRYDLLYRANGPTRHAIFVGVVLLTLLPWPIMLADDSDRPKRLRLWALLAAGVLLLGIFSSVSRGPALAAVIVIVFAACSRNTVAVAIAGCGLVTMLALVAIVPDRIADVLEARPDGPSQSTVVVLDQDGQAVRQNSARSRLLVLQVYGPLVVRGGPIGYGTAASTGFPPRNLPGLTKDPVALRQIAFVDNAFIGIGLRFGWVGFALLIAVFFTAAGTAFALAPEAGTFFYPRSRTSLITLGITIIAAALVSATVYFDRDHGFWVMFLIGSTSGVRESIKGFD